MCTCLEFKNIDHYFGRTLDLEYHYKEEAVITPRNYLFKSNNRSFTNKYALIGTALVMDNYPFYYEAANECGLAMAGLNFPYNAKYNEPVKDKLNLAVYELIPYILGNYQSIKELIKDLENLNITNECYNSSMPITPLHYMISDENDTIVLEQTINGTLIYSNEVGAMTNNPTFDLNLKLLDEYTNLTNRYKEYDNPVYSCVGLGALGLPGDFSSQSRFVKTVFLRKCREIRTTEEDSIADFFHILDSVSMPCGSVKTKNALNDITFYTSCINTTKGIYYYKTYYNNQISSLKFTVKNMSAAGLTRFPLAVEQNILCLNGEKDD